MGFFDLPLDQLRTYRPELPEPAGFHEFWRRTLADADRHGLGATLVEHPSHLRALDAYELTWNGWGGEPVKAWVTVPHGATGPLPAVIQYRGYARGRGFAFEEVSYSVAGFVHVLCDARGQGWMTAAETPGTPDNRPAGTDAGMPGVMTDGIASPETYYYRRFFTDAARLVRAVAGLDLVDPSRIALTGGSQGGGTALAATALTGLADTGVAVRALAVDVPFLCHFRRSVGLTGAYPYQEVADLLQAFPHRVDEVFATLDHFDGVHMAARCTAPALFSLGLMDTVSPPSSVFAAYNAYAGQDKDIVVYPYNGHEGGQQYQLKRKVEWLWEQMA